MSRHLSRNGLTGVDSFDVSQRASPVRHEAAPDAVDNGTAVNQE
jgi:hypothetical protein